MLKLICIIIGLAAIVGLGIVIDSDSRSQPGTHAQPSDLTTAPIYASGRIEGATEEIELRPELRARVIEVLVREGQQVEAGDVLVRLDGAQQEYKCSAAEADVAMAQAELERLTNGARDEERREAAADVSALSARLEAKRQWHRRIATLREKGASTAQELDDLAADLKILSAQIDAAQARNDVLEAPAREDELRRARAKVAANQAQLELARHECGKTTLHSPIAAQVLRINAHPGELVGPEAAEPALVVADTSRLFVRAYVDELDAPRLRLGMPAEVTADGLPGNHAEGQLVRMAPRMTQKPLRTDAPAERFDTKVREVWIELAESGTERFVVGLPVDVVLEVAR